jgi:hypothetical protein
MEIHKREIPKILWIIKRYFLPNFCEFFLLLWPKKKKKKPENNEKVERKKIHDLEILPKKAYLCIFFILSVVPALFHPYQFNEEE